MSSLTQPVQGMSDVTGGEARLWRWMEEVARGVMERYGFVELRTPILEYESVFRRAVGETTDVVQKEMFAFERAGRRYCMRPEGTAGVMRHAAGLGPADAAGARWHYWGPMFRCERPQAGRKRQFHQCGVECLEEPSPVVDAEVLALQVDLLRAWGLDGVAVQLNTRGAHGDHAAVAAGLRAALGARSAELCEDCRRRMDENVLRVLDCKEEGCKKVVESLPPVTEWMGEESRAYLERVESLLRGMGVQVRRSPLLVRGLDYYEHTIWEIVGDSAGAQNAIAGGGRYRMDLGGRELCGVGFAIGIERVAGLLASRGLAAAHEAAKPLDAWLVGLGDAAVEANLSLMRELRAAGLSCRMAPGGSAKSQMRAANKSGARFALIRGDDELAAGTAQLKDMAGGGQEQVAADAAAIAARVAAGSAS